MFKSYFKLAWRNLVKSAGYSMINIGGLAVGMAVALLIGLWIWDELVYNKYFKNYDHIAQVMQNQTFNGQVGTQEANPAILAQTIRAEFGSDFKYVVQSSWNFQHTLAYGDRKFLRSGSFVEPEMAELLALNMLEGSRDGLKEPSSVLISKSVAKSFFGNANPVNKILKMDSKAAIKVAGVYEDFPYNSDFYDMQFLLPWALYLAQNPWIEKLENPWGNNFTRTFAQIGDHANMAVVSKKIRNVKLNHVDTDEKRYNPIIFLHSMKDWHLRDDFKNGANAGGRIEYVWLFGIVGVFVLLLACINFMNLSTARSEKRAREVGVRKAIGSERRQLMLQFFSESYLVVVLSFVLSIILVALVLPTFNQVAGKQIELSWTHPVLWSLGLSVCLVTGLVAGSYPAFYLSSFKPARVLKGVFRAGRFASLPRQTLVILQFSVSVILAIATVVVFEQIQHARNRPVGYDRESLITVGNNDVLTKRFEALRNELKNKNLVVEIAGTSSALTAVWNSNGGFHWEGKDPNLGVDFPNTSVSYEFGKVIGWEMKDGRDFSRSFLTDSAAFIINESAARFMGMEEPVGKTLVWDDKNYTIVGVIKDMLAESPYEPVRASLYHLTSDPANLLIMKINPALSSSQALTGIESVFKSYDPASVFEFKFVDEDFAKKFEEEERIGKLSTGFAVLAVFISCLGLFGLSSFVAEQRTKEIGIRKVLGASVANLWATAVEAIYRAGVHLTVDLYPRCILLHAHLAAALHLPGCVAILDIFDCGAGRTVHHLANCKHTIHQGRRCQPGKKFAYGITPLRLCLTWRFCAKSKLHGRRVLFRASTPS